VEALSEEDRQTVVWTQEWERSHGALQARDMRFGLLARVMTVH
jgi:hypothetical protein